MAKLSRLQKVRKKKEARQATFYFILAGIVILVLITWGIPAFAKFAGLFVDSDDSFLNIEDSGFRPTPPILSNLPEATPSASIKVEGFAGAGLDVVLFLDNAEEDTVVADDGGNFEFRGVGLKSGKNIIYAIARSGDKESEKSRIYEVVYDATPPSIEINSPENNKEFYGESERVVSIKGVVDKDVENLTVGGRIAIISTDGSFSVSYPLEEGSQDIPLKAVDEAGNTYEMSITLSWRK